MRLGMPCYPSALLSKKPAYFVQLLKEKLTPLSNHILGHHMLSETYFFRKVVVSISDYL
jgi:hypothetical protein